MNKTTLDASDLEELFRGGAANLKLNTKIIDDLNVFPIPDGDTGSNMLMTIEGAVRSGGKDSQGSVSAFAEKFSKGALLGARGNSGVILSQFIKGFSCGIEDAEDTDSLDMAEFTRAFKAGVDNAYSAVI